MKSRFTTIDIIAIIKEITKNYVGHRVTKVYDIDNKTFLIKLSKPGDDGKAVLLIESGIRIHITDFEWPKNAAPSQFSMKLRKHIRNKRLESIKQLGSDRIIDLQFGVNEFAFHLIIELYDRGNIILSDHEYCILNLVRPRVDASHDLKFITKENYPVENAKLINYKIEKEHYVNEIFNNITNAKSSDNLRKICLSLFTYGPNLLEHLLIKYKLTINTKLSNCLKGDVDKQKLTDIIYNVFCEAEEYVETYIQSNDPFIGYLFGKANEDSLEKTKIDIYDDFHPILFSQLENKLYKPVDSFNKAVDEFFSVIEAQKSDQMILQKEKAAMKKLENIKQDHHRRLNELREAQSSEQLKGEYIQMNVEIVDRAIMILNHALANKNSWESINEMVQEGKEAGDTVASNIMKLDFLHNEFTMRLYDLFAGDDDEEGEEEEDQFMDVNINLSMNAFENVRNYYNMKKFAKNKEAKTVSASDKALKSAEVKTKKMLKEVQTTAKINKMRKSHWFEKFNWFITSENYLVVGGKDQQQNELLVKRYMKAGDIYVHADIHGASTVIVKNHQYPTLQDISPKSLTEAAQMAVVYSSAWDSKISVSAWWVHHNQVSKTAPSGEYLSTGSFMIRGKKNFMPATALTFGFGILFKLTDESIENHRDDRKIRDTEIDDTSELQEQLDELNMEDEDDQDDKSNDSDNDEQKELNEPFPDVKLELNTVKLDVIKDNINNTDVDNEITFIDASQVLTSKEKRQNKKVKNVVKEESLPIIEEVTEKVAEDTELLDRQAHETIAEIKARNNKPLTQREKNKLKRMKNKYKDQDEEERKTKMAIIHGINPYADGESLKPLTKKQLRKKEEEDKKKLKEEKDKKKEELFKRQRENVLGANNKKLNEEQAIDGLEDQDDDNEDDTKDQEQMIINSLTGTPVESDELLYAIPVLAPYQTLQHYKFKVKMIPGTTKRGKACKNAFFNFLMDRNATTHEKDLLKVLKDQDASRNFPGCVKIYTQYNAKKGGKKN